MSISETAPLWRLRRDGKPLLIYPWVPTEDDLKRLAEGKAVYIGVRDEDLSLR